MTTRLRKAEFFRSPPVVPISAFSTVPGGSRKLKTVDSRSRPLNLFCVYQSAHELFDVALRHHRRSGSRWTLGTVERAADRPREILHHNVVEIPVRHGLGKGLVNVCRIASIPGFSAYIEIHEPQILHRFAPMILEIVSGGRRNPRNNCFRNGAVALSKESLSAGASRDQNTHGTAPFSSHGSFLGVKFVRNGRDYFPWQIRSYVSLFAAKLPTIASST